MDAPALKNAVKIRGQRPSPLHHRGRGVVQGAFRVLIVPLPAVGAQNAFHAHPVRRAGEELRRVLRVVVLRVQRVLYAVIKRVEGSSHLVQAAGQGLPAGVGLRGRDALGQGGRLLSLLLCLLFPRQEQEEDRPHPGLDGQAQIVQPRPAPKHRCQAGHEIDQRRQNFPLVPAEATGQSRHGKDQAVIGILPRREVQGHPGGSPRQDPAPRPPAGGPHDSHRRQQAAQRKRPQKLHAGQRHQQRAAQHQHPRRLLGRQVPQAVQCLRPLEEQHPVGQRRAPGAEDFRHEVNQVLSVPPVPAPADDAGEGAQQAGNGGHEPGRSIGLCIKKGKGHRIDQNRRGGVPHPVREALQAQVPQAGPGQRAEPADPRPGRRHRRHAEGGVQPKQLRPGQHRTQQKAHPGLCQAQKRPAGYVHGVPPGEAQQLLPRSFFCCHTFPLLAAELANLCRL